MPQVAEVFTRKNADKDLAEAVAYASLTPTDALFVHVREGWKVADRSKADTLRFQGLTLCLDNLSDFLGVIETSDDGKLEAAKIKQWMIGQK